MTSTQTQKLNDMIRGINIAMMTTMKKTGDEKFMHSRPMATLKMDEDKKQLYFFSDIHSLKMWELDKFNQCNVSYSDVSSNTYVSISGEASVDTQNRELMKQMWNSMCKAYFPKGVDDPDLALIIVKIKHVEYWDAKRSAMVEYLSSWVQDKLTGKVTPPQAEHQTINM
jgi:general stress protein 26